jgi:hypothetical protein
MAKLDANANDFLPCEIFLFNPCFTDCSTEFPVIMHSSTSFLRSGSSITTRYSRDEDIKSNFNTGCTIYPTSNFKPEERENSSVPDNKTTSSTRKDDVNGLSDYNKDERHNTTTIKSLKEELAKKLDYSHDLGMEDDCGVSYEEGDEYGIMNSLGIPTSNHLYSSHEQVQRAELNRGILLGTSRTNTAHVDKVQSSPIRIAREEDVRSINVTGNDQYGKWIDDGIKLGLISCEERMSGKYKKTMKEAIQEVRPNHPITDLHQKKKGGKMKKKMAQVKSKGHTSDIDNSSSEKKTRQELRNASPSSIRAGQRLYSQAIDRRKKLEVKIRQEQEAAKKKTSYKRKAGAPKEKPRYILLYEHGTREKRRERKNHHDTGSIRSPSRKRTEYSRGLKTERKTIDSTNDVSKDLPLDGKKTNKSSQIRDYKNRRAESPTKLYQGGTEAKG